jgi:penicillin-binding protein 2
MIKIPEDRRPPLTPQLALRVGILGGIALLLFAIIFFRLWYLQVLSGEEYLAEANDNRVREVRIQAPRGDIVDRHGTTLVDSRVAIALQVEPRKLPEDPRAQNTMYRRISWVTGVPVKRIRRLVRRQQRELPYSNVTIKTDVPRSVYSYVLEHKPEFPAVAIQRVYLRRYPHKEVAAHIFGTVGEVTEEQLKEKRYKGVEQGTIVGQSGLEYAHDRYLRGRDGAALVQVDALGRSKGELRTRQPVQGKQLKLSLDLGLQKAGERAIREAGGGKPGAFVALDPRNGEVLAMGSYPSFDPNLFSKPIEEKVFARLNSEEAGRPLLNRAIQGEYPTGSTFKIITALGALDAGLITPSTIINDGGSINIGGITFGNARGAVYGPIALARALTVSSDVFFYTLGMQANGTGKLPIQKWMRKLGLGKPTGIDLPNEYDGLVPTPQWRNKLFKEGLTDRGWTVGDMVNLSVGQGDVQATPLQMAVAYAAVANGGKVVKPHIGIEVENAAGEVLQKLEGGGARKVNIRTDWRQAILEGLRGAASADGGTSAPLFKNFPRPVHGKTGTAERPPNADQSWYVAYVPDPSRPIVIAATIEEGGFGAEAAAPAVRTMLSEWFHVKPPPVDMSTIPTAD